MRLRKARKADARVYTAIEDEHKTEGFSADEPTIKGWPTSPRRMKRPELIFCGELALMLLPGAFISLAVAAWLFDGRQVSPSGKLLQRVILLGPTLFPLAFAGLGGRTMNNLTLWRAERGSTIGNLEKLHGSQSLVGTISSMLTLGPFNAMSILLLLFWTLSPLGGQSSLRLLREGTHTTSEHHYVAYADRNAWSTIMLAEQSHLSYISSIMSSTIMTSTKSQSNSADLWGHPKIPRVMELELAARNNTSEAWGLPIRANNTRYTSMIGPSVTGLQPNTTITFKMPYEYLYVDCRVQFRGATEKKVREYFKSAEQDGSEIPPSWQDPNASMFTATVLSNRSNLYSYESSYFLVVTHDDKYRLEYLFYGSKDDHGTTVYACTVNSLATYVFLKCESANCLVEYMTSLREDVVGTQIVDGRASNLIRRFTWSRWFFRYLASVGGTSNAQTSHPIDNHVYGSMSVALPGDERSHPPIKFLRDWSTVADEDVSQRLTEVLNTFWETSRWVRSVVLNDPYGSSSIDPATGEPYLYLNLKRTDAILSRQFSIYKANKPWIYTLLFCSGVLFLLGFVNMIVVLQTSVPDVFGYVSSLTRDNVYMDIPDGGTTLDGSTRAKLLRNVKVQLADVKEGDRVGHLALKSFEPGVVSRSKLPWQDRLYT